jgi:hypothetical protein
MYRRKLIRTRHMRERFNPTFCPDKHFCTSCTYCGYIIIMSSLKPILASNALIGPQDVPKTAVFVGATDGIGKATLQALVSKGFPTKIYIVGRNKASHRVLLEDLARYNPRATLIFFEGQLSLVADAQRIASQIATQEDRVDLLFLSSGYLPFTGRKGKDRTPGELAHMANLYLRDSRRPRSLSGGVLLQPYSVRAASSPTAA